MALLIDGYNLLNAVGITGPRGDAEGVIARAGRTTSLHRSRVALLNFLVESLDAREIAHATVVFDAAGAPPGLPRALAHRGLAVRFAPRSSDADSLLEELIGQDTSPRRLTVVSSDHRVQRAAKRRRARAVDSDVWYAEIVHRRRTSAPRSAGPASPKRPLDQGEVEVWLRQFGGQSALEELFDEPSSGPSAPAAQRRLSESEPIDNPFPPGYGEDLLAGE
jgi:predicted RNA-binding protein with PIN domain